MEKETLFIAFSTQKGGAGKTTLTVLVASYLHYVKGMNVAVVDCDYPQHSIAEMRKRDLKTVMEDEHYKLMAYRQLQRIRKKAYPIAESTAEDAVAKADELLEKMPETDIVFFDLPGTVNSTGVLNTLANMDYVFSPIAADRVVMESTLRFASRLNDTLIATGKTNIKGLYLLWNMVDGREKSELYKVYEQVIGKYSINSLVYWVTYVHNVVYSFYRSMIYCYINSTQRCAGSIVIDIIPTNGADKRKFFPFAPYFPVTNVIKRYFYPYFPAIIGIKGYSFPYFPYLSGIMKIKTALYSLFSRLDWHKTVVFPCLGEIYEGIRSLSWEIPVT